ncbi:MAG: hypothetical protein EA353_14075 [Puniceicoccaceae bacterium]|nr:MAG: hypothetical protein EA353_14075 [Puniceicoccaceae bacterium]
MNPDIVYLHTSLDPSRVNALWISVYSAKRACLGSRIRCIVSKDEVAELKSMTPPILQGVVEWVPVQTPDGSSAYQSRWIKTQLVKWLDGTSLYMDSDTLVVRSLNWDELSSFSFATVLNRLSNQDLEEIPCRIDDIDLFDAAGWEWDPKLDGFYRNSGVMYIRPDQKVHEIFSAWHQKWLEFVGLTGRYLDQPALNVSLLEHGWDEQMGDEWNAPVRVLPASARGALIYHYYSSVGMSAVGSFTLFGKLVQMMQEGGFNAAEADNLLARGKVYVGMGGRIKAYWLAGQYVFMFRAILTKLICTALGKTPDHTT